MRVRWGWSGDGDMVWDLLEALPDLWERDVGSVDVLGGGDGGVARACGGGMKGIGGVGGGLLFLSLRTRL